MSIGRDPFSRRLDRLAHSRALTSLGLRCSITLALMCTIGCGGRGGTSADAAGNANDGSNADATAPLDAPSTLATVVVRGTDSPALAGVPVVFGAADGSVVAVETTDATGTASHAVSADASVTVVRTSNGEVNLVSELGIQPGDTLFFGEAGVLPTTIAHMTVNWPGDAQHTYRILTPCGTYGGNVNPGTVIDISNACSVHAFDLYVVEIEDDRPTTFLVSTAVTAVEGGTVTLTGPFQPFQGVSATLEVPTGMVVGADLTEVLYGNTYGSDAANTMDSGSGVTFHYNIPPETATTMFQLVSVQQTDQSLADQFISRRLPFTTAPGFNVGAMLLPWLAAQPFDIAHRTASWTASGTAPSDMIAVGLNYVDGSSENS